MRKGMCEGEEKRNRGLGGEERGQGGAIGTVSYTHLTLPTKRIV